MNPVNTISLRIYGGARGAGVSLSQFVSVGDVPNGFRPAPPTIVDEKQSWMITHAQGYTSYVLYSTECRTVNGQPGQIHICLFVPEQKRLADGKSPLSVLHSVMDVFSIYGLRGGQLLETSIDHTPFAAVLNACRLEDRQTLLPVMQGRQSASFCADNMNQIDALMRYSRYPALSGVGRLELGLQCRTTISLPVKGTPAGRTSSPKPSDASASVGRATSTDRRWAVTRDSVCRNDKAGKRPLSLKGRMNVLGIVAGSVAALSILLYVISHVPKNRYKDSPDSPLTPKVIEIVEAEDSIALSDSIVAIETEKSEASVGENAKEEILRLVNKGDLKHCRNHERWHELSVKERNAVECVLGHRDRGVLQREIDRYLKKEKPFKSWPALIQAANHIQKLQAEDVSPRHANVPNSKRELSSPGTPSIPAWQNEMGRKAKSCPLPVRLGVRIASISYTSASVTCTLSYEEISKYDISEQDRQQMASDYERVKEKYFKTLPSNIQLKIIRKDRADRLL